MSDDDDYFTDDICFDDQTLAILDREEQKYHANTAGPTSKRQRTDNGWKAGIGANVALPEISLDFGGSYDVRRAAMNSLNTAANLLSASSRSPAELYTNSALTTSEARSVQAVTTTLSDAPRPHVASASTMLFNASANALTIQLQELQQKLEQMSEENKRMQTALHDAKNAKLAKEGEVSILRRNAEKTAQEHSAQLNKLKASREESDRRQERIQKELREETERLKTQLVFKQHEQESAIRPPQSVRHKRVSRDNSFTASATPLRLHRPGQQNDLFNPHTVDKRRNTSTPALASSPAKNRNTLPGFENAFGDTTPLPPSRRGPNPGTSRHNFEGFSQQDGFSPTMPRHSIASIETHIGVDDPTDDSFMESAQVDADRDVDMPFGTPEAKHEEQDLDDIVHALEPPDWRVELNRIILMHILPPCPTTTIQLLLGAQTISMLDTKLSDGYTTSCSRCLQIIASASNSEQDWRSLLDSLSETLLSMILPLIEARCFRSLAALLNLLSALIYHLPGFNDSVLSQQGDNDPSRSRILVHLTEIILQQGDENEDALVFLVTQAVNLLEVLSLTTEPGLVQRLAYVCQQRHVLMHLFRANQLPWLLARSARLLVMLASHQKLCRFLLSMPYPGIPDEAVKATDAQKIPLVERLCLYLMDASRSTPEYKKAKVHILTFFALLSNSQSDVHTHLLASTTVLPSLVFFLAQLTSAFWEDDEDLLSASPEEVFRTIQLLNQTLFLLHHFVFTSVSFISLLQKLQAPQHRLFHGLMHMFIVTFGRLSYGEAPEWMDRQGRIELVSSTGKKPFTHCSLQIKMIGIVLQPTDMARDILDHVVDGPEADRIWQAFQFEEEKSNEVDDDLEEQFLSEAVNSVT